MAKTSILLAGAFYLELIRLTETALAEELKVYDEGFDVEEISHHLWLNYFKEFKELVRKKNTHAKNKTKLQFPSDPLYFYKRRKNAESSELKGINRNYFQLILIVCEFENFDDAFKSTDIKNFAKADQLAGNRFEKPSFHHKTAHHNSSYKLHPIQSTLDLYANSKWWFYFYGYSNKEIKPLVRLKMFFEEKQDNKYPLKIINTNNDYPSYSGFIRVDESNDNYIVCELKTIPNSKRLLHIKFQIQDIPPEIMFGVYNNFDRKNLVGGSIILQRAADDFDQLDPKTFSYHPERIEEMNKSNIPEVIQYFFNHGMNNSVKMPSSSISTLKEFEDWKKAKQKEKGAAH